MTTKNRHVVVDGSNIATEGRSLPSLAQLNEAVLAFLEEHPDSTITVVVDATFGHRIDKSEVKEFDDAVANNELVAPPAGAVGRGDAFVLGIANKAGATILSNDSFQEFHGDYPWLFDEGRLIGGKPVPHIGWVFVARVPVRGPVSRKAVRESRSESSGGRSGRSRRSRVAAKASASANEPMPVPTSPPPGRARRRGEERVATTDDTAVPSVESADASTSADTSSAEKAPRTAAPPTARDMVNELVPFLEFVEHHAVGTTVEGVVESYSSHGAYVRIGEALGYVPLRLMADPPPRSAREVMKIGDTVSLVVADFAPGRRSIDCAVPAMASTVEPADPGSETAAAPASDAPVEETPRKRAAKRSATRRSTAKKAGGETAAADEATGSSDDGSAPEPTEAVPSSAVTPRASVSEKAPAKKAAAKKEAAKKARARTTAAKKAAAGAAAAGTPPAEQAAVRKVAAKKSPARKAASQNAPARKAARKKTAAKKTAATKTAATKTAATTAAAESAPAEQAPAATTPADPAPAKKAPARKVAAKKAPAKRAAAKKAAAKKAPAKKAATKKAAAKKTAARTDPAAGSPDR